MLLSSLGGGVFEHKVYAENIETIDLGISPEDIQENWSFLYNTNWEIDPSKPDFNMDWKYDTEEQAILNGRNTAWMSGYYNPSVNLKDYSLEFDVTVSSSYSTDNDVYGFMFRLTDNGDNTVDSYVYLIHGTEEVFVSYPNFDSGLYKITGKSFDHASIVPVVKDDIIYELDREYTYKLETNGSHIQIWRDGQSIVDIVDDSIAQGSYGFFTQSQPGVLFQGIRGSATLAHYTATFDSNGGTKPTVSSKDIISTYEYGKLPTTSRDGYIFNGWYTAKTGGTKVVPSTIVTQAKNHTLYAQWTPIKYNLVFDPGNGIVSPQSKKVTFDSSVGSLPTPTLGDNSVFGGWYTSDGTKVTSSTKHTKTGDVTVYAKWGYDTTSQGYKDLTYNAKKDGNDTFVSNKLEVTTP